MFRRSGRGRVVLLVFLALSILLITLDFRSGTGGPLARARDISAAVVAPIQRGFTAVFRPVGDFFSSLGDLGSLRNENEELRDRLAESESDSAALESLRGEFAEVQALLDLPEPWSSMDHVDAVVFGDVPANYKWGVFIDKGRADGIEPDMAVISPEGALVGKIVRADSSSSVVLLMIDPQAGAAARIEGSRDIGQVEGNGASRMLSFRFIDPESDVSVGDQVMTSAYGPGVKSAGIFPPGIPVGTVARVAGDDRTAEADIDVEPLVDFSSLDYVRVLVESGPFLAQGRGD